MPHIGLVSKLIPLKLFLDSKVIWSTENNVNLPRVSIGCFLARSLALK